MSLLSLKRKTPPTEEDVQVPTRTPSLTSGSSRPASCNGDMIPDAPQGSSPIGMSLMAMIGQHASDSKANSASSRAHSNSSKANSVAGASPVSGSSPSAPGSTQSQPQSQSQSQARPQAPGSTPGPAPAPASASASVSGSSMSPNGAKHRRTGSASGPSGVSSASLGQRQQHAPGTGPSSAQGRSAQSSQSKGQSPLSIIVPEALHARFQHAAFPHAINLVPAPLNSVPVASPMPGQPPPTPVVVGQVLHPSQSAPGGVIASPLLNKPGGKSSPLNRAAVLAAAERSGVKALNGLPCINALWHIESETWGDAIPIHGIMDGYSKRLLALRGGESSHPKVVAALFRDTVKAIGCYPARVRADERQSIAWVKERMRGSRGKRSGWFIHGPPESNQHLAPIWAMIASHPAIQGISAALEKHAQAGIFDKNCPLDLLAVQVAYLPQLNAALDQVRKEWNRKPLDGSGMSKDAVWTWNIQEWSKRGRYPATEPESVELPREALAQHSAEEFVNYGATGGPYIPCSVHTNRPSSENGDGEPARKPVIKTIGSQLSGGLMPPPSPTPPPPLLPSLLSQAPLDEIGCIDPCLRLWLDDFPLPKAMGYAGVRAAMGEFIAEEFPNVADRFRVGRDRAGIV